MRALKRFLARLRNIRMAIRVAGDYAMALAAIHQIRWKLSGRNEGVRHASSAIASGVSR